ncbi:4-hydroxy-tetrahydrodipicolinate reductase [Chryseobacterium sp. JUb7]|uniref:4-hydroxy-tetrahydrodipicolinate reductase n=1 Tax=Chryseobacterium sp. JUb7 TaxID=2940599 RepID=UPI0021679698|nr:dihydrodipicolinate reductase C-terminal domain-containing protein [Chryseobacterium sp. JUb7]MCS3529323.1 4-hydroxy-tetrahydrodipicolinate reductase [Chryseobacterium sp. JUb7]
MKIGLIGFGKAGKAVANVILQNPDFSLEWVLRNTKTLQLASAKEFLGISSDDPAHIFSQQNIDIHTLFENHPVDFIIDFSTEDSIYTYGKAASEKGIKIISAISHYQEKEQEFLKKLSENSVVFWSPNITVGVNYLLFAASLLKNIAPDVDIEVIEEHFKAKSGISGTAVKIAETLDIDAESINSVRAGGIVGKHEVIFGFPYQTVRLVHESISREAFGNGALFVAKNIKNKEKGYYNFEHILKPYFFNDSQNAVSS